ncbi:peptide deformylase, mitochondrial [Plutella xylostella]|uniref:peptide deformylase, mitochondrial n=1 Tax=Plutella xylostella TaxID=51655 RepID=UPI002032CA7C|nr:peptide deformylase, mitochondrial [Plutella xylostella]
MSLLRKTLNWYARLSPARGKSLPPYTHVVQIGDPTLRRVCEPVPLEKIKTDEIQTVIKKLNYVMNKYHSVGMSAPQIGVNLRIFVMRVTALQIGSIPLERAKIIGMTPLAHAVYINPEIKVVDYQKVVHTEGCESFKGYSADVPRYKAIEVSGYNAKGEPTKEVYKDWGARIAQHEMDHLDGKLYVDIMDRKTLHCLCWEEVNLSKGKVTIPFTPE